MLRATWSVVCLASAAGGLAAQWYSYPFTPNHVLSFSHWSVVHDTGAGIAVFSTIAQRWDLLSPPGSSIAQLGDAALVVREGSATMRGWSAFTSAE